MFQWDVWIGVGSSADIARALRNPETRPTPSYTPKYIDHKKHIFISNLLFKNTKNQTSYSLVLKRNLLFCTFACPLLPEALGERVVLDLQLGDLNNKYYMLNRHSGFLCHLGVVGQTTFLNPQYSNGEVGGKC